MSLSREQILGAQDLETRVVDVPEWGGKVNIKALSGTERNAYEQSMLRFQGDRAVPNLANSTAKLLARAIVDDAGERLFTDAQIGEVGKKNSSVLNRLYKVAAEMSGLDEEDISEEAKNSDAALSGDSISSSPETFSDAQ